MYYASSFSDVNRIQERYEREKDYIELNAHVKSRRSAAEIKYFIQQKKITEEKFRNVFELSGGRVLCPLGVAIQCNNMVVAEALLAYGFTVTTPCVWSATPFSSEKPCHAVHNACRSGHLDIVERLINIHGTDMNDTYENGKTPLCWAMDAEHRNEGEKKVLEMVKFLVEAGGDPGRGDTMAWPPLHECINHNYHQVAEYLLAQGASVNITNRDGKTAMFVAVSKPKPESASPFFFFERITDTVNRKIENARFLLKHGADVSKTSGLLPLSVNTEDMEMVKLLVSEGVDPEDEDEEGNTAVHFAAQCESDEFLRYLVFDVNASIDKDNSDGLTPFLLACQESEVKNLRVLLEAGYGICQKDSRVDETEFVEKLGDEDEELASRLEDILSEPLTLKDICCYRVRRILCGRFNSRLETFPVPEGIKEQIKDFRINLD